MRKIDEHGGPAFPCELSGGGFDPLGAPIVEYTGMSLRDWFAGQALVALNLKGYSHYSDGDVVRKQPCKDAAHTAEDAFRYADAMLAARKTEAK